jgi:hypothetical protein
MSLKSIKQATTYLRRSVQIVRENHPAQTLALLSLGKTFGDRSAPSRVKRCATPETHGNSPLSIERLPERGGNMGYIDAGFTADAPQGENQ